MSKYIVDSSLMTGIADNIRLKTGEEGNLVFPTGFNAAIESLPSIEDMRDIKDKVDDIKDILDSNESEIDKTITTPVDIASFSDGADDISMALKVAVEPVQDLHGYENPWPEGGGKNLCALNDFTTTKKGVAFAYANGKLIIDGTPQSTGWFGIGERFKLPAGTYTISYKVSGNNPVVKIGFDNFGGYINFTTAGKLQRTFTLSEEKIGILDLSCDQTTVYANTEVLIQIESGSVSTDFVPYSNVCPISGFTGCEITLSPTLDADDGTTYTITFPDEAGNVYGGELTVNKDGSGTLVVDRASSNVVAGSLTNNGSSGVSYKVFYRVSGRAYTQNVISNTCARSSSPHSDAFYMTVRTNSNGIEFVMDNKIIGVNVSDDDNAVKLHAAKTWFTNNPVQLVYELAEPIVYQFTDLEVIETLKGLNNIWADTGKINGVEYSADSQLCITNKLNELDSLLSTYTETQA